jgi:L-ascorbate metabolism protein UlaG (beta-lactamase superfamily)
MKITLLGHSGFVVEGKKTFLVFDYYTDAEGVADKLPFGSKNAVFLASHAHRDHFNRKIFGWADAGNTGFVLGKGIPKGRVPETTVVLGKGQSAEMLGVSVRAHGSTDAGVSFMAEFEGRKVFHAGDLNDWYWEEESTRAELKQDEQRFLDELEPLRDAQPDAAFVPLDGRLGKNAFRGPIYFVQVMKPKLVVPMHLCGGEGLPGELRKRLAAEGIGARVAELIRPGDSITV